MIKMLGILSIAYSLVVAAWFCPAPAADAPVVTATSAAAPDDEETNPATSAEVKPTDPSPVEAAASADETPKEENPKDEDPEKPSSPSKKRDADASDEPTPVDEYQILSPSRRRLAEVYQIGSTDLRVFRDGRPLIASEHDTVCKVLYRLPSVPAVDVAEWAKRDADWSAIEQDPWRHRANVFYVQGYVKKVIAIAVREELVPQFGFDKFYQCEMELVGSDRRAMVLCRDIPKTWSLDTPMHEFAAAYGWFLKAGTVRGDRHNMLLAASRVAWYPTEAAKDGSTNPGHVLLAKYGMDIGLWAYISNGQGIAEWFKIRRHKSEPDRVVKVVSPTLSDDAFADLLSGEREAFYQLLTAASKVPIDEMKKAARDELALRQLEKFSVVPLFNDPKSQHGRAITLKGVARKAIKVIVGQSSGDPAKASDVKERFGLDHYYVVHFFTGDSQNEPLLFITKQLPVNMPRGDAIREPVRLTGFFFKKYAYPAMMPNKETSVSELVKREAPLLVGGVVEYLPPEESSASTFAGVIAGLLFVVALGGIWLALYFFGASDKKFQRETVARAFSLEPGASLDDLETAPVDPVSPPAE